jgi:branched-chain amino acid transport system substrate-binding protein
VVIKAARTKPDYGQIIPELIKANVQSILWIASGTVVSDGVKALRTAGSTAQIVTLSNNASSGFIKGLGENSRGVIVSQVFPYERSIAFPFVKEAREMAKARNLPEISPAMLEGFAAAKVLVEGLRRAGPKPTRESLINALETLDKFNLGGLEVSYSPTDHTGLDFADLSIIGVSGKFRR